jgi:hypothetical protein
MDSADLTPAEQEAVAEAREERTERRDRTWADGGRVRYAGRAEDEKVVERHPMVEEVVVRRRVVDDARQADASPRRLDDTDRPARSD